MRLGWFVCSGLGFVSCAAVSTTCDFLFAGTVWCGLRIALCVFVGLIVLGWFGVVLLMFAFVGICLMIVCVSLKCWILCWLRGCVVIPRDFALC